MKASFNLDYLSRKCRVLSFIAAVAVVAIHSDCTFVMSNPSSWSLFIQKLYCQRLMMWAVPFFFLNSGMWFGRSAYVNGCQNISEFYRNKIISLIVPYLLFAVIGVAISTPLAVITNYVAHRPLLERTVFDYADGWMSVNHTFGITIPQPDQAGFLWFLRTLSFLFVLAPVWRCILRLSPQILIVLVICFKLFPDFCIPGIYFNATHTFFLGIFLGFYKDSALMRLNVSLMILVIIVFIGVVLAVVLSGYDAHYWHVPYMTADCAVLFLGASVWFLYDKIASRIPTPLPNWVKLSMWMYLSHNLIGGYFLAGMRFVVGKSDMAMAILPFINTLITTTLSIIIGLWLKRCYPSVFKILCGNRGV